MLLDNVNQHNLAKSYPEPTRVIFADRVKFVAVFACFLPLLMDEGIYLSLSLSVLFIIISLFSRQRQPGILLFVFAMQWLQVVAYFLWMKIYGLDINSVLANSGNALLLSNIGLLIMAFIIFICTNRLPIPSWEFLRKEAAKIDEKRLLILYAISTVFLGSIGFIFGNTSSLAQILSNIGNLKWIFLTWLAFVLWINKNHRLWLIYIVVYEFSVGLFSYFSSFKEVLFYMILFSFTLITKVSIKQLTRLVLVGLCLVMLLVTWSAIKSDYREFLNKGTMRQSISVERDEAINQLGEQLKGLSIKKYQLAIYVTLYRVQYVMHFAMAMDRVPDIIPYQGGAVWWENVTYVITPRMLFPEKKIYDASVKTNYFTGSGYAGYARGASFSLGYFADSYVDFGPIGMFIPLIGLALIIALIYRLFYKKKNLPVLLRFALINLVLYEFKSFESDGLYLFGRLVSATVVFYFLAIFFFPTVVKWVTKPEKPFLPTPLAIPQL